jgi:copper oxidase (laccase) domain-containing protein
MNKSLPGVPASFYWTDETWGPALRCRPLDAVAQHLFTTRQLQLPSPDAWQVLASAIGVALDHVVSMNQVHGREVVIVRKSVALETLRQMQKEPPQADALISDASDAALVVRAADCVPLLIGDNRTGAAAAVHAVAVPARVAIAAIDAMGREFGSRPADLVVAIGPAIGLCYEVAQTSLTRSRRWPRAYLIDRWFMTPRERKCVSTFQARIAIS